MLRVQWTIEERVPMHGPHLDCIRCQLHDVFGGGDDANSGPAEVLRELLEHGCERHPRADCACEGRIVVLAGERVGRAAERDVRQVPGGAEQRHRLTHNAAPSACEGHV